MVPWKVSLKKQPIMAKEKKYEDAVKELELIVTGIEQENISIDELSNQVKKAIELIRFCKEKLYKTEEDVKLILNDLEKL